MTIIDELVARYGKVAAQMIKGTWKSPQHVFKGGEYDPNFSSPAAVDAWNKYSSGSPLKVRMPFVSFLDMIREKNPSLRNQFETNSSQGEFNKKLRRSIERHTWGYPNNSLPEHRPKYGYIGPDNDISPEYGGIVLEMNPSIRNRTTWKPTDSLASDDPTELIDSPMSSLMQDAISRKYMRRGFLTDEFVPELQFHGPVSLNDVSAVHASNYGRRGIFGSDRLSKKDLEELVHRLMEKAKFPGVFKGVSSKYKSAFGTTPPKSLKYPRDHDYEDGLTMDHQPVYARGGYVDG